jgi:chitodextrinase
LIELRAFARSPSETIPDPNLIWNSNLVGTQIGTGHIYEAKLPLGQQTVTLTATDSHNGQASTAVTVNVVSDYIPSPQISAPVRDPQTDTAGTLDGSVTLMGSAFDQVDGDEPPARLRWSSDIDGFLGTGKSLPVKLSAFTCAPRFHVVTSRSQTPPASRRRPPF